MSYRGDLGSRHVELLDAEELLLFFRNRVLPGPSDVSDQKHVWAIHVQLEPIRQVLPQHAWRKRPERLSVLHFQVQLLLHRPRAWICNDGTPAKRARAELHSPLKPADSLAICKCMRRRG